jgi:hypothetical protein
MKLTRWLVLGALLLATGASHAEKKKPAKSGSYVLTIDDTPAMVPEVSAGSTDAAPVSVKVDRNGSEALWQWMSTALSNQSVEKTVSVDATGKRRLDMAGSHITEIKFPPLDAKDGKKHVNVTLVIQPGTVTESKTKTSDIKGVVNTKQKKWLSSNFRLRIGDLPTKGVKKVDAISFKLSTKHPAKVTVPDIKFLIDSSNESAWTQALKSKAKKSGSIELTEDDGTVWKTLDLTGVRVKAVTAVSDGTSVTLKVDKVALN